MTKKKGELSSLMNQDWKKVQIETAKVNKLFKNILIDKIPELNDRI